MQMSEFDMNGEELPPALWKMLIDRSPLLQTIVLGDRGPTLTATPFIRCERRISVRPLVHARWPRLRSLSISCARIIDLFDFNNLSPNKVHYAAFIASHHGSLRHLSYYNFEDYRSVDYRDPPFLERQGCDPDQWNLMPLRPSLQEIVLIGKAFRRVDLPKLKTYLSSQRHLRKLEVSLNFSKSEEPLYRDEQGVLKTRTVVYDQIQELRELVESCPRGLESLKLFLSTVKKDTIYWVSHH